MTPAIASALLALAALVAAVVVIGMLVAGASTRALEVATGVALVFAAGAVTFRIIAAS
jgi:hypothetical protein